MSRLILKICMERFKSLPRDESGAAVMITLAVVLFLYLLCSSVYAVGMTVNEKIQLQNACDAAAYSGAVVEADCLSRIATINRAMSWTYIQTVKRRMDYIVLEWLKLTVDRFKEDEDMCRNYNSHNYKDFLLNPGPVPGDEDPIPPPEKNRGYRAYSITPYPCSEHESGKRGGGTWWCGWTPQDGANESDALVRLGYLTKDEDRAGRAGFQYGRFLKRTEIRDELLHSYGQLKDELQKKIVNDDEVLAALSALQFQCVGSMNEKISSAALNVLRDNLPRNSGLGDDEYFYRVDLPSFNNPYLDLKENELWAGVFSACRNTEEDELEFLAAALNTDASKEKVFSGGFLFQDIFGGDDNRCDGIDQWFIRGSQSTLTKEDIRFAATADDLAMRGIQRGYKSANRAEAEAATSVLRGNHVAYGNNLTGSAQAIVNWAQKSAIPVLCSPVIAQNFSTALGKFNAGKNLDIVPSAVNSGNIFVEQCKSTENNFGLVAEYHWASMRWWCARLWGWIKISRRYKVPRYLTEMHFKVCPVDVCSKHGNGGTDSNSRGGYKQCYVGKYMLDDMDTHGSYNDFPGYMTMGYSRVYGDDRAIFKSETQRYYMTPKVMPMKLNRTFFQERINVVAGKRQKNPFRWMYSGNGGFRPAASGNSVFAMFDPMLVTSSGDAESMILASSSAAAAFRSRRNPGEGHYETNYDQISSFEYDDAFANDEPTIALTGNGTGALASELRIGCPHRSGGNRIGSRMKQAWNLCETDWQAVFVPQHYADFNWIGRRTSGSVTAPYDSFTLPANGDVFYCRHPRPPAGTRNFLLRCLGFPEESASEKQEKKRYLLPLYGDGSADSGPIRTAHPGHWDGDRQLFIPGRLFGSDSLPAFVLKCKWQ